MNTAIKYVLILIVAAIPFIDASAEDGTLNVTPGNYLIKRETSSDTDPNAIINDEEKCITDPIFKPESVLPASRGCTASNIKKSGSTVTFDITCTGGEELPPFTGKAEYSSNGMAIGWHIVFTFKDEASGQTVTIINKADGKRIGDCKPQQLQPQQQQKQP